MSCLFFFFFSWPGHPRDLHSFPTRRSSDLHGMLPDTTARLLGIEAAPFFATGVSLVIHPRSPYVPTVHANFRYFGIGADLDNPDDEWFGGGADLTPYFPYLEDARHFHQVWKDVRSRHPIISYDALKHRCDEDFFLPPRGAARGGGRACADP